MSDLRHAARALAHTPLMATVIVLSLGIGVGVNAVVFSWIQALTLRPLPGVSDASRFHLIEPVTDASLRPGSSWLEYRDLASELSAFDSLIAFRMTPLNVGTPPRTERASALLVSGNYFAALGLQPARGRFLRPDEAGAPGRAPVAVVSYAFWQSRLGGSADVIGRVIRVNDSDLSIIGVTPERFQGTVLGLQFDLWVPATMAPVLLAGSRELEDRNVRGYYVMGALRPGVPLAEAQANAAAIMQRLSAEYPQANAAVTTQVLPFWRAGRGPQGMLLQGVAVLQGVMLVLLLAVCSNTANLMLARASVRRREVGVRIAVGASGARIARLLLIESALLGVGAVATGVLIAFWGTDALRAVPVITTQFPVRFQTDLDVQTLLFDAALGMIGALLFGAPAAIQLARLTPDSVIRPGAGQTAVGGVRTAIMAAEVGLAAIVLVVAGLFFNSFQQTEYTDPGFRAAGVLLASYELPREGTTREEARQFAARVLDRLQRLPDVEAAALAASIPLDIHGLPSRGFALEGRRPVDGVEDRALSNTVTPGYFDTMGIAFVEGHDFAPLNDTVAPRQVIVNQEFVRRYVGEGNTVGRRLIIGDSEHVVVGVVRTSLNESFSEPPTPVIYLSYRDRPSPFAEMHVRTLGDEATLTSAVRQAVRDLDASLPVFNVRTLTQHVDMNLALRRIPARMFMVLGPLMLVLAASGIYAVVAYNVANRTAEIGVRMALGADARTVIRQILSENLRVVVAGAAVGWAMIAYVYVRLMRGELELTAFAGLPLLLLLVAATACWVPARRASRINPVVAMRAE